MADYFDAFLYGLIGTCMIAGTVALIAAAANERRRENLPGPISERRLDRLHVVDREPPTNITKDKDQ